MSQLKVSARSNPNAVAGAFAGVIREHGTAEVIVVGAGALNQAVKAVAIARGFLEAQGVDLACVPAFHTVEIDGEDRTALKLVIEPRAAEEPEGSPDAETAVVQAGEGIDDLRLEPDDELDDLRIERTPPADDGSRTVTSTSRPPPS